MIAAAVAIVLGLLVLVLLAALAASVSAMRRWKFLFEQERRVYQAAIERLTSKDSQREAEKSVRSYEAELARAAGVGPPPTSDRRSW
jgi:uncharacterized membrane protein YccC